MKNQNHAIYKATSLVLATCFLLTSLFTFHGCSYEEDYSVLKEDDNPIPNILSTTKLLEGDEIVVKLKEKIRIGVKTKATEFLKSTNMLTAQFGTLNWTSAQLVAYDNGLAGIYVPFYKEGTLTAFLISNSRNFNSVIVEVLPEKQKGDDLFSGKITFYTLNGKTIVSSTYTEGIQTSLINSSDNHIIRIKTRSENNCDFTCTYTCFINIMGSDWVYGTVCATACMAWETAIGLFICIPCIGGPALTCLDKCCNIFD